MEFIQLLECDPDLLPLVKFLHYGLLPIIQIGIPIILIVMGSVDLGKAVLSSDDKEIKGATTKLIKRAIAAVAVFFVGTLVSSTSLHVVEEVVGFKLEILTLTVPLPTTK